MIYCTIIHLLVVIQIGNNEYDEDEHVIRLIT